MGVAMASPKRKWAKEHMCWCFVFTSKIIFGASRSITLLLVCGALAAINSLPRSEGLLYARVSLVCVFAQHATQKEEKKKTAMKHFEPSASYSTNLTVVENQSWWHSQGTIQANDGTIKHWIFQDGTYQLPKLVGITQPTWARDGGSQFL